MLASCDLRRRTFVLDPVSGGWKAAAAYLYALRLNGSALAWEYLRRNPEYRVSWEQADHADLKQGALHWGLRFRRGPQSRCSPGVPRLVARVGRCYSRGPEPRCHVGIISPFSLEAPRPKDRHSRWRRSAYRLLRIRHRRTSHPLQGRLRGGFVRILVACRG